jgi:hypothetical protein
MKRLSIPRTRTGLSLWFVGTFLAQLILAHLIRPYLGIGVAGSLGGAAGITYLLWISGRKAQRDRSESPGSPPNPG